jgi:hypothetical protein
LGDWERKDEFATVALPKIAEGNLLPESVFGTTLIFSRGKAKALEISKGFFSDGKQHGVLKSLAMGLLACICRG